jgi:hypothetical protein
VRHMSRTSLLLGLAVVLNAHGAAASFAPHLWPQAGSAFESESAPALTLADSGSRDRLIVALERKYNAKVVRITDVSVDGRLAHDVRLLSNDRVWTVRVDAATGQEMPRDN